LICFKPLIDSVDEKTVLSDVEIADRIKPHLPIGFSAEEALTIAFNIGMIVKRYSNEEYDQLAQTPWRPSNETDVFLHSLKVRSFPDSQFFDEIEPLYLEVRSKFFNQSGKAEMGSFLSKVSYALSFLRLSDSQFLSQPSSNTTSYTVMSPAVQMASVASQLQNEFPDGIVSAFEAIPKKKKLDDADSYLEAILEFVEVMKKAMKRLPIEAQTYMKISGISF
jgi:hypothetical protein